MRVDKTQRGFEKIVVDSITLVQQSSAVGDYPDSFDKPGSSALWMGEVHCSREQVVELRDHLNAWIETGSLEIKT